MLSIPQGWRPILSEDGTRVAFGNGFTRILDIQSGAITNVGGIDGDVSVGSMWPCGWFQGSPATSVQAAGTQRVLQTAAPVSGAVAPEQCPGYRPTVAVIRGRVVSSLNGVHFVDGVTQRYQETNPCWDIDDFNGDFYIYKETNADPWPLVIRRLDGTLAGRIHDSMSNARVFTSPAGEPWVFANVGGQARVYPPTGPAVDTPAGESRGVVTWRGGELLVWTVTIDNDATPVLLGRPVTALGAGDPAIQLRGLWFAGLDVAVSNDGYRFAGYFDGPGGTMFVDTVPHDAPRTVFRRLEPPLDPLPAAMPAMLTGYLGGESGSPGSVGGTTSKKAFLLEGFKQTGEPWFTSDEERDVLRLIFVDPQESHARDVELANALAAQDRSGAWLNFYCDRPQFTDDVLETARAMKAQGRPVLLGLRAYPKGPNDTAQEIAQRLQADIDRFRGEFKMTVYGPAYTQSGFWPLTMVRQAIRAICDVVRANPQDIVGLFFFGWQRPPVIREIEADVEAVCAAAPMPDVDAILSRRRAPFVPPGAGIVQPPAVTPAPVPAPVPPPAPQPPAGAGPAPPAPGTAAGPFGTPPKPKKKVSVFDILPKKKKPNEP